MLVVMYAYTYIINTVCPKLYLVLKLLQLLFVSLCDFYNSHKTGALYLNLLGLHF